MANRTRNIVLRVPVTAEERAMIERKMQQMGTGCFSVYARKMLIDGYVIRLDYSIFSLVVRPCVQQRLRGCCEDFDFSVRQLIQQRFKLHPLRGLALHSFTMKNLIHRDMIAGHQF